jgi:cell division protein FtsB
MAFLRLMLIQARLRANALLMNELKASNMSLEAQVAELTSRLHQQASEAPQTTKSNAADEIARLEAELSREKVGASVTQTIIDFR